MVILILIGAMLLVGIPLYIQYRISGSPSANAPMPRSQSSWHHHHPKAKSKVSSAKKDPVGSNEGKATQPAQASDQTASSATQYSSKAEDRSSSTLNSLGQKDVTTHTPVNEDSSSASEQISDQTSLSKEQEEESEVCCGLHEVCEKLATNSTKVEYFDDEELDAYAGRDPQGYNDSEIDQFREVMTTMYPSEVALWRQSLQLRGIALPSELEDEFMLILSEV